MTQKTPVAQRAGALKIGLDELVGFAGFAAFVVAVYGLFFVAPQFGAAGTQRLLIQGVAAAVLAAGFAVMYAAAHWFSSKGLGVLVGLIVLGAVSFGLAAVIAGAPLAAEAVLVGLAALGLCALGCLWFSFLCLQPYKLVCFFVSSGMLAAMAGCFLAGYLQPLVLRGVGVAAFAVSALCLALIGRLREGRILWAPVPNAESDRRSTISIPSDAMLAFIYFEAGYAAGMGDGLHLAGCFCVGSALSAAVLVVDAFNGRRINERSMLAPMVPMTVGAFLLMFSFGPEARMAAMGLLGAICTVFLIFGWTALASHVQLYRLSAMRVYARARIIDSAAAGVGAACGFGVMSLYGADSLGAIQCTIVIAIAYAALSSFCRKPRFPETVAAASEKGDVSGSEDTWQRRCRALAEQCDLSERQTEVLVLIAQGRNAKYIQGALTISLSTAQTHIRNIYRKAGVHSRQELLNLIEETKLFGED